MHSRSAIAALSRVAGQKTARAGGRRSRAGALLALAAALAGSGAAADELEDRLRHRLEAGATSFSLEVAGQRIHSRSTLRGFYPERGYSPAWVNAAGLTAGGERFVEWLERVPRRHGLDPRDYHVQSILALEGATHASRLVDLELALSDAFLMLGAHFAGGRLDAESLQAQWLTSPRHGELAPLLGRAANAPEPGTLLEALLPDSQRYAALVARLAELRRLEARGGWPAVEPGPALREGDGGPRVAQLVRRLRVDGDLPRSGARELDEPLVGAVRRFQARHGLDADGVVGAETLRALNTPAAARIEQILVNLERWRWLPETLGERYVLVNIAGFGLSAFEDGERQLDMRVVVGTPYRRTPVFSDRIRYLVLNPAWEVPNRIAVEDKLPLIKDDPAYLERNGYALLSGWGADERRIDPGSVDWSAVSARRFPYRLRQAPGPGNALGRIKFMFPNEYSVYLHDTPAQELFARPVRAFSSGCIRVEAPLDLAAWLLRADERWTRGTIERAVERGDERMVLLHEPVPVHLLYLTAWVDTEGSLHFREDIYGRDAPLFQELREPPPS